MHRVEVLVMEVATDAFDFAYSVDEAVVIVLYSADQSDHTRLNW